MVNLSKHTKDMLASIITKMSKTPQCFVKNPGKDFTRNRKLTFETVINLMLSMGGNSLCKELLEHFNYNEDAATSSAFVQQRSKILPSAFEYIFNEYINSFSDFKTFNGYRLFAVDGSDLNIAHNPCDNQTYIKTSSDAKGYNLLHLNAMYDLCNKLYVDACIQPIKLKNEYRALTDMVERSKTSDNVIVIADRGYESYNVFAHIEKKGWKYVIRVKDKKSSGIVSSLNLPNIEELDEEVEFILTRKQTKEVKSQPHKYKFLPNNSTIDYLDLVDNQFYPIKFRVVRFKIGENSYETIITNLSEEEFDSKMIKEIYQMRWGIETSFRELKYVIGLINFHSKKVDFITQEVFARLTMYNFCEVITMHVIVSQKQRKHEYQVNFTIAIHICKHFFKFKGDESPPNVEALIQKNILPIRKGRKDPRKLRTKTAVSFIYRIA